MLKSCNNDVVQGEGITDILMAPGKLSDSIPGISGTRNHVGFAVGAGVEWALLDNWTAKAEYMYYDLGSKNYFGGPANEGIRADVTAHTVKLGVNYRFGYGKGPIVANY